MKLLIIGGTGTISSAITRQLSESDHEWPQQIFILGWGGEKMALESNGKSTRVKVFRGLSDIP